MPVSDSTSKLPRILLIDDDEAVQELLGLYLIGECTIETAFNGPTALEMAGSVKYDLIFLDINLGRQSIDGLEVLKKLRLVTGYQETPVIALTAYAMIGDKEEFLSKGCNDYISKPFNREILMRILSKYNKTNE
ncbi:MAG: response regulator [Bacteroidetes bacterium]|nr:response regulator [Bacteroidota bacterium]